MKAGLVFGVLGSSDGEGFRACWGESGKEGKLVAKGLRFLVSRRICIVL